MRKGQALGIGIAGIATLIGGIMISLVWRFFLTVPIDTRMIHLLIALLFLGSNKIGQFILISDIMRDIGILHMVQNGLVIGGIIVLAIGAILTLVGWINYRKLK